MDSLIHFATVTRVHSFFPFRFKFSYLFDINSAEGQVSGSPGERGAGKGRGGWSKGSGRNRKIYLRIIAQYFAIEKAQRRKQQK